MYLKYRERHAMKLKQGISKATDVSHREDGNGTEILSETIVTDVQNGNVFFDDKASDSGLSQTSYAPTLMSGGDITIPAPPQASQNGMPFECPYCFYMITAPNSRSWNRHVFNDLQPYICTEIICSTPDKLYSTRHEWLHHLRTVHHGEEASLSTAESRYQSCALCGKHQDTSERNDRHMARHLQELALFVLPRNDEVFPTRAIIVKDQALSLALVPVWTRNLVMIRMAVVPQPMKRILQ